jgi:hypothetical protein
MNTSNVDLNSLIIKNPATAESVTWTQRSKVSTDSFEVQLENLRTRYVKEINDLRIERDVYKAKYESVQKTLDEITRMVQLGAQK